jgi:hypothetical protein
MSSIAIRELRQRARADLRAWQAKAVVAGLDQVSDVEIEVEITAARVERKTAGRSVMKNRKRP